MTETVIEIKTFSSLSETMGEEFMHELVDAYLNDTPSQIETLTLAMTNSDPDTFRRAAHSIKSTSLNFGAQRLSDLARSLEDIGRAGSLEGCEPLMQDLVAAYSKVKDALKELGYA